MSVRRCMKVVVEMRNDVAVKGTLTDVDDRMNCVAGLPCTCCLS